MKQIKKHFVWILCTVFCLMSLTACGKTAETESSLDPQMTDYMVQTAGSLLEEVTSMAESEIDMIIDQQAAEDLRAIRVWRTIWALWFPSRSRGA